jgi:hypothetical protein
MSLARSKGQVLTGCQPAAGWQSHQHTSAKPQGNKVKGTVLLVVRKPAGKLKTTRDDLAWESMWTRHSVRATRRVGLKCVHFPEKVGQTIVCRGLSCLARNRHLAVWL